ncbi:MAG TPA: hypothetical protein PKD65_17730 [Nitrospira sp.]|nr:hypothetical protein [Nitrospira sp.]HNG04505.1 hypothetical protein [Nitrospira sp.]
MKRKTYDPILRVQPWRVMAVFQPLERVLARLEIDGTVDTDGRQVVFKEGTREDWYDLPAAIRGVAQFHDLAGRHGVAVDVTPLERFANKLEAGSPVFEQDIETVKKCINACWQQALMLRESQATSLLETVRISEAMDDLEGRKAA